MLKYAAIAILCLWPLSASAQYPSPETKDQVADRLIAAMNIPEHASTSEAGDIVRQFIWTNSVHRIDQEFYNHWNRHSVIADKMLDFVAGKRTEAPHMECSSRRDLMMAVMKRLGYRVRSVDRFAFDDQLHSHSFLEIYNPETQYWEIQDVDHNVFWMLTGEKRRAGIADIIRGNFDNVIPCRTPDLCDPDLPHPDMPATKMTERLHLMDLAYVGAEGGHKSVLFANKTRVDLSRKLNHNGRLATFCELQPRQCAGDIMQFEEER